MERVLLERPALYMCFLQLRWTSLYLHTKTDLRCDCIREAAHVTGVEETGDWYAVFKGRNVLLGVGACLLVDLFCQRLSTASVYRSPVLWVTCGSPAPLINSASIHQVKRELVDTWASFPCDERLSEIILHHMAWHICARHDLVLFLYSCLWHCEILSTQFKR